jgi:hypothetical protein
VGLYVVVALQTKRHYRESKERAHDDVLFDEEMERAVEGPEQPAGKCKLRVQSGRSSGLRLIRDI